jgi:acetate CoA/acetoacetate CoA-transferase alpha subunit
VWRDRLSAGARKVKAGDLRHPSVVRLYESGRKARDRALGGQCMLMQRKALRIEDAAALVPDGCRVMIGGFMGVGAPLRLIDALIAAGRRDLTLIINDTARADFSVGKLVAAGCARRIVASHIGRNTEAQRLLAAGALEVEFVPQGSLAERIRAGGAGLGGVLTRTGLGTLAAEGKPTIELGGETWLIETALRADVALVAAAMADHLGNLAYTLTAQNFNPLMAMAADLVIAEAREIVPVGVIPPDQVRTPGALVDHILEREA